MSNWQLSFWDQFQPLIHCADIYYLCHVTAIFGKYSVTELLHAKRKIDGEEATGKVSLALLI